MVFHRAKHKKYKIVIEINNVPIEQVRCTKFLGVIFDDNLDWSDHISYINTKIVKGIGIICRTKKNSTTALINLYHAFVFLYLIYCVEVWGNALHNHVQPLIKLQNKILKIITPSHRYINKEQLYARSGILPFKILVKHGIGLLMYKLSNGNVPKPLLNIYKSNKDIHIHLTRQAHHFRSRRGNTEFVYRTFAFQSVFIWNKIIPNLDISVPFTRFKHLLKEFLLSNDISFRYTK